MKKLFLLFFALLSLSAFAALSLVVKPLSGSECITALGNIGKIAYSGDSIYVYDCAKELVFSDLLANVQHVRFSDEQPLRLLVWITCKAIMLLKFWYILILHKMSCM